jgi:hypothetical protein
MIYTALPGVVSGSSRQWLNTLLIHITALRHFTVCLAAFLSLYCKALTDTFLLLITTLDNIENYLPFSVDYFITSVGIAQWYSTELQVG